MSSFTDGDDTIKQKQEKQLQRAKKRALSSSVIRELKEEYYDGPEEIKVSQSNVSLINIYQYHYWLLDIDLYSKIFLCKMY